MSPALTTDAALTLEPQRTAIFSAGEFTPSTTQPFGWGGATLRNPFVELRATAEKLSVRELASMLGVSHTAVYGWIRGERAPEDREKAAIRLKEALAEITRLVPDRPLPEVLRAETVIGLSARELIKAGEYDAAVGSVLMISSAGATSVPFGEGMELLTAAPVPRWADSISQPDVESAAMLEDDVAFIPSENDISVVAAVAVG